MKNSPVAGLEAAGLVEVVLDAAAGADERGFLVGPAAPGLAEAALASFLTPVGAAAPGLTEAGLVTNSILFC